MGSPEIPKIGKTPERQEQIASPAELAWKNIEAQVAARLRELFNEVHDTRRYEENEQGARIEKLQNNEKVFFTKVVAGVEEARQQHEQVTVLFDVDETLAKHVYKSDNTSRTFLRPSAVPLMEFLKNTYQSNLGLFTSRGGLEKQLENAELLAALKPYMDTSLLFSTRDYPLFGSDSIEFGKNLLRDFGGEHGIVDDALVDPDPFNRPGAMGDIDKLQCLKLIREKLPEGAVVIVDDMVYPEILSRKNGLYGVSLNWMKGDSGVFHL
ncbi:MAG TPA: hypothetical protein VN495_01020 [Candidatus Paceibacterota bacterium]|nr:hypothetical protein [Candidatus Paceibacterota bacterium]